MKAEPFGERTESLEETDETPEVEPDEPPRKSVRGWLRSTNESPGLINLIRRARNALPGDPYFGDRLSSTGFGGPQAAARAAHRLLGDRDGASREFSLATLQVWQALNERFRRRPAQEEVTLVFTDLVDFSRWALEAGDDATLRLLRRVAQAIEPPLLEAGGQVVKRMGDGIMACFPDPLTAITAVREARRALKDVEVEGYTPKMRVGIHTGRPQRIGSDWLGVDVNIAARVMESAGKGGALMSGNTLERLSPEQLDELGIVTKRIRRTVFSPRPSGVPADITMYRLEETKTTPTAEPDGEGQSTS